MDYEALLQELYHLERFGIKLGLDTITELLGYMGNPQRRFKTVHVTGTNGKGSVCAYIASVLQKAGYRVGLFTSPHLVRFNERIQVDGREISNEDVARIYAEMQPAIAKTSGGSKVKQPTFFEVTTALAFHYFAEQTIDIGVIEVGMGGRMDATNVVRPLVAVITRIGLEHTEHLGKTEDRIAREKSGIIKPGCWVVTVDQPTLSVIADQASANGCPMSVVGRDVRYRRLSFGLRGQRIRLEDSGGIEFEIPLLGVYQPENAAIAYAAIQGLIRMGLKVPNDAVVSGFRETSWPGRLQVVRSHPTVIVDSTHNAPGVPALAASLLELFPGQRFVFVLGILNDKDLAVFAEHLGPLASQLIATMAETPRSYLPEEIARAFAPKVPNALIIPKVSEAVEHAIKIAGSDRIVVVSGSIYTAGEALAHLQGREG
ncbi:MAG TPA: folylpolyglutamate synthase/dihydrofolate synthase family protein [Thermoplasmata archaeon]|nr:folylpolyglutamate synthase/dihydrofolate synthase family protein [Thermoplasmata archaeon]